MVTGETGALQSLQMHVKKVLSPFENNMTDVLRQYQLKWLCNTMSNRSTVFLNECNFGKKQIPTVSSDGV